MLVHSKERRLGRRCLHASTLITYDTNGFRSHWFQTDNSIPLASLKIQTRQSSLMLNSCPTRLRRFKRSKRGSKRNKRKRLHGNQCPSRCRARSAKFSRWSASHGNRVQSRYERRNPAPIATVSNIPKARANVPDNRFQPAPNFLRRTVVCVTSTTAPSPK